MINASTIEDIEKEIANRRNENYIALILFCRYREDKSSLPWRVAANYINYHHRSGEGLDIYVPGFSFYGSNKRESLGDAMELKNSEPFGFYYPKALVDAEDFFKKEMAGFHLGSSVVAVAIEVDNGSPDWKNGAVMNLSNRSAEDVEAQLMEIIDGCKSSQGMIAPNVAQFNRSFRLNGLVGFLLRNGWNAVAAFSGVGALILA